jgi:hypothetical protein
MKKFMLLCLLTLGSFSAFAQKKFVNLTPVYFGERIISPNPKDGGCSQNGLCKIGNMNRVGDECSTCPQAEAEISVVNGRAAMRFKKASFKNGGEKFFAGGLFLVDSLCAFSAEDLKGSGLEPFKVAAGKYKIADQGEFFFVQF